MLKLSQIIFLTLILFFSFQGRAQTQLTEQPDESSTLTFQPGLFINEGNAGIQLQMAFLEKDSLTEFFPFLPANETQGIGLVTRRTSYRNFSETGFFFSTTIDRILVISKQISTVLNLGISALEHTDDVQKKTGLGLFFSPEVHFLPYRFNDTVSVDGYVGLNATIGTLSFVNASAGATFMYTW